MRVVERIEAHGERIAASPASLRWAVAYGDWVRLFDGIDPGGQLPDAPEHVHDLRYAGATLLAAPSRAADGGWAPLPRLQAAVDPWHLVAVTWAGDDLLVAEAAPPGGFEQNVRLYDGTTRVAGAVLWADSEWMRVEVVAAGGSRLAAGALEVRVWAGGELGTPELVIPERGIQVRRIVLDTTDVIVGYADGHVAVHGRASWRAHADETRALALDGTRLATGGWDGRVALWTLDGEPLGEADVGAEVADVTFLTGTRLLALHQLPETGVSLLEL